MRKWLLVPFVFVLALVIAGSAAAGALQNDMTPRAGAPETATRPYAEYTYYSELAGILVDIARRAPDRVQVIKQADSANGKPLYLVVITRRMTRQQKQVNDAYRKTLLREPGYVLSHKWLRNGTGIRPAVFVNCSIHGGESTGMDAGLRLIRRLAFRNDATTRQVLDNLVVVVDPCQNPDGRITDSRANGSGFDLNRDFVELSQAEARQTVKNIARWVPLSFDDLHGYVNPMLIEPATFPHNPSLEYDLLVKNTLHQAAVQKSVNARNTGHASQIPYLWGTAADKSGKANEGMDDYGPYYAPQIAQCFGSMGQTVETPSKTNDGVAQHYWVAWASVKNCLDHKWQLAKDQATMLMRGDTNVVGGRPWTGNMTSMIRSADPVTGSVIDVGWFLPGGVTGNPAFPYRNEVGQLTFPYAYVIPTDRSLQQNPAAVIKFVNRTRLYGAEVDKAKASFVLGNVAYPAGTYVVKTAQPLRPLVNNLLWDGEDVCAQYGVSSMSDVSVWSLPYMWRFDRVKAAAPFSAKLARVTTTQRLAGTIVGAGPTYSFAGDSNAAVKTVNQMLSRGFAVGMVTRKLAAPNDGLALGSFLVDATRSRVRDFLGIAAHAKGISFITITGAQLTDTAVISTGPGRPRVVVNADGPSLWAIKTVLGFDRTSMGSTPGGNAFVNGSSRVEAADVQTWLNGDSFPSTGRRRTYIGIDDTGSSLTALIPGVTQDADPDPRHGDNGFCPVAFKANDVHTAGYPATGFVFTCPAAWFTVNAQINPDADVDLAYKASTAGIYQSGFWNDPANTAAAVGRAAQVTYEPQGAGAHGRVVLMGFCPLYRAQPEGSFLLVARQIFLAASTPPAARIK